MFSFFSIYLLLWFRSDPTEVPPVDTQMQKKYRYKKQQPFTHNPHFLTNAEDSKYSKNWQTDSFPIIASD